MSDRILALRRSTLSEGLVWKNFQKISSERTLSFRLSILKGRLLSESLFWQSPCFQKVFFDRTLAFKSHLSKGTPFRRCNLTEPYRSEGRLWKDPSFQKVYSVWPFTFRRSSLTGPFLYEGLLWKDSSFQKVYSERILPFRRATVTGLLLSEGQLKGPFFSEGLLWQALPLRHSTLTRPFVLEGLFWQDLPSQNFSERTLPFRRFTKIRHFEVFSDWILPLEGLLWENHSIQKTYSDRSFAFRRSTLKRPFLSDGLLWQDPCFQKVCSDRVLSLEGLLWNDPCFQKVYDRSFAFRRSILKWSFLS